MPGVWIEQKQRDVCRDPSEAMRRESGSIRSYETYVGSIRSYETWVGIYQKLWDVSRDVSEAMWRVSGSIRNYATCVGIYQKPYETWIEIYNWCDAVGVRKAVQHRLNALTMSSLKCPQLVSLLNDHADSFAPVYFSRMAKPFKQAVAGAVLTQDVC